MHEKSERKVDTTFLIVDAQSVKNTDTAERKGYDGGKKIGQEIIAVQFAPVAQKAIPHNTVLAGFMAGSEKGDATF